MKKQIFFTQVAVIFMAISCIVLLAPQTASGFRVNSVTITVVPEAYHDSATVTASFNITHEVWQISSVNVRIKLYDDDNHWDDVLGDSTVNVPFMSQIPNVSFTLTCSPNGKIRGPAGSSWESSTGIYVRAPDFGPKSNIVKVAQTECEISRQEMDGPYSGATGTMCSVACAIGDTSLLEGVNSLEFGIGYDSDFFNILSAVFTHPSVSPYGTVDIAEDTIFFSAILPDTANLTGPIASFDLEIRADAPIGEESVLEHVGDCGYYDPTGWPLVISFYDDHSISVLPPDITPPIIDPTLIHISQYHILGMPGATQDDWMTLPEGIRVELIDLSGEFVAGRYADSNGGFDMEHFWLESGTQATLIASDLLGHTDEFSFIVEPSYLPFFHDPVEASGPPGSVASVLTGFFNRCEFEETYEIRAFSQQGWTVTPDYLMITLNTFMDTQLQFDVDIPPEVLPGTTDTITLVAVSTTAPLQYFSTDSMNVAVTASTPVAIELTPLGITVFPATGGILEYNIAVSNSSGSQQIVDIWTDATLPNGMIFGPIIGPLLDFTLEPLWSGNRDREQTIPGNAPPGIYTMNAYLGEYDEVSPIIFAEDHFEFEKLEVGEGILISGWFIDTGQSFDALQQIGFHPSEYGFIRISPNPFNPSTTISFSLPEASIINLTVYDVSGRLVATLADGWRDAGIHEVTFDGSELASGIYLYHIKAGEFTATGKMVLVK